ncbi:MAG TPA: VTT domain-containing protein [Acidimicrobiia bacterium]|nr:VTT domain-containing protein [Acidimicrobiia bacterium]
MSVPGARPTLGAVFGGLGLPAAVALLIPMEAGVPIPIPDDLVMLLIGERTSAGEFPWWVSVLALELVAVAGTCLVFYACRGPGHAVIARMGPRVGLTEERIARFRNLIETRGRSMMLVGRGTPGLRTITAVAAGTSGISARKALPPLIIGASVFVQLHLVLGALLGPLARELFDEAKGVAVILLVVLLAGAAVFWFVRRGRRRGAQSWCEAACPLCLGIASVVRVPVDAAPTSTASPDGIRPADPRSA